MNDEKLSDRMKAYEAGTQIRCMPLLPICARIDGKCFHQYCKGLERPFDMGLIETMRYVTSRLVRETDARVGYTQSDEISLIWHSDTRKSEVFFSGKLQKICSVLASMATLYFNQSAPLNIPTHRKDALFDCRVWQVPNLAEAANVILWREQVAVRNSINMLGQAHFSHNQLHGKNAKDIHTMLKEKGVYWDDLLGCCKRGSYFARRTTERRFTWEELQALPEKHAARLNPELIVSRSDVVPLMDFQVQGVRDKVGILFPDNRFVNDVRELKGES